MYISAKLVYNVIMKPTIKQNISAMRRFPINTGVLLTDNWAGGNPTHRVGFVVGFALNSLAEVVIEVEVISQLHGDFEKTINRVFIHPGNNVTVIQPLSEV